MRSLDGASLDAAVDVNGRRIPWSAGWQAFVREEDGADLVRPGEPVLFSATIPGTSHGRVFRMPLDVELTTLAAFATVSAAGPLRTEWGTSPGVTTRFAGHDAPPAGSGPPGAHPRLRGA